MPAVTRVPPLKQALAGAMRLAIEGSIGAWPGGTLPTHLGPRDFELMCYCADNPNQCTLGYNCPPPTLFPLDPYIPVKTRYIDVSAGGPNTFKFTATTNASWLIISPASGTVTTKTKDVRVELSADWSKVPSGSSETALVTLTSSDPTKKQQPISQGIYISANNVAAPSTFKGSSWFYPWLQSKIYHCHFVVGFVEGDGGISIEASHFAKSAPSTAANATWVVLPGYGRTLAGVTITPAGGGTNYTAGTGPSL